MLMIKEEYDWLLGHALNMGYEDSRPEYTPGWFCRKTNKPMRFLRVYHNFKGVAGVHGSGYVLHPQCSGKCANKYPVPSAGTVVHRDVLIAVSIFPSDRNNP